ncbi:hypothetical protein GCK32_016613 [Trichostrongylus colubriformis]|uniref:Uncharacterized protein n=1 Tax=Trichostrongylus colubriformis TaxID=6319 RepID=A0AAN8IH59_TRICO
MLREKLLKRKRKKILSDESPRSLGSVESRSIMGTPKLSDEKPTEKDKHEKRCRAYVTSIELQTFFEPPETMLEMEQKKHLSLPPSNEKELQDVKTRREEFLKTVCKWVWL